MALTSAERREALAATPWIDRLKEATTCDALKYNHMPLKAIYSMGGKPPTGTEKYKCKSKAYWRFRALRRYSAHYPYPPAKDGNFCYNHLIHNCIHYNPKEQQRFYRWYEKWKEQRAS